jgi:hypothetical protein
MALTDNVGGKTWWITAGEKNIHANNFGIKDQSAGLFRYVIDSQGNHNFKTGSATFGGAVSLGGTLTPGNNVEALVIGSETNSSEGHSVRLGFKTKVSLSGGIWTNAAIDAITTQVHQSAYGSLAFSTMNATTMTEKMRITPTGNIGIGTTTPNLPLAIQANSGAGAISLYGRPSDSDSQISFFSNNQSTLNGYLYVAPVNFQLGSTVAAPMTFITNSSERMRITPAGNIGIGTTDPQSLLHLYGGTYSQFQMNNSNTGNTLKDGFRMLMDGSNVTVTNREAGYMAFETSDTEKMRITPTGNVGIGTTDTTPRFVSHET